MENEQSDFEGPASERRALAAHFDLDAHVQEGRLRGLPSGVA